MTAAPSHPLTLAEARRNELAAANLGLVHEVVRRMAAWLARHGVDLDDAVQAGCFGLMDAAEMFDPARGLRFSTYAWTAVKRRVIRLVYETVAVELRQVPAGHDAPQRDPEPPPFSGQVRWRLKRAVGKLPGRWQQVLRWRFEDGLPLREVAARLGVSNQRAHQLQAAAVARLRKLLGAA